MKHMKWQLKPFQRFISNKSAGLFLYRNGKMDLKTSFFFLFFFLHFFNVLYPSYEFFKIDWTLNKLVLFQKMMALVLNFTSDWIFAWQNMASIGDLGVKKLPHFYEFCSCNPCKCCHYEIPKWCDPKSIGFLLS